MRSIDKGPEPAELSAWKARNAATPRHLRYDGIGFPREAVRRALLLEQRHLCAYTMQALLTAKQCERRGWHTGFACHIEHFLPQARQIAAESIDYRNMLACHPPSMPGVYCGYGAQHKAAYDPAGQAFVSPLSADAASHFAFHGDGRVLGLSEAGRNSVRVLNLNHPALVHARQAAISHALRPRANVSLSPQAARKLAAAVLHAEGRERLPAYCVAIAQAALKYAEREERRAARRAAAPR